jgi:hypothetical protein
MGQIKGAAQKIALRSGNVIFVKLEGPNRADPCIHCAHWAEWDQLDLHQKLSRLDRFRDALLARSKALT